MSLDQELADSLDAPEMAVADEVSTVTDQQRARAMFLEYEWKGQALRPWAERHRNAVGAVTALMLDPDQLPKDFDALAEEEREEVVARVLGSRVRVLHAFMLWLLLQPDRQAARRAIVRPTEALDQSMDWADENLAEADYPAVAELLDQIQADALSTQAEPIPEKGGGSSGNAPSH